MISLDHRRAGAIATLDRVGEAVLDTRVDLERGDPARGQPPLDAGDERPHQTLSPVAGIDEHVQETRPTLPPFRSGDCESHKC